MEPFSALKYFVEAHPCFRAGNIGGKHHSFACLTTRPTDSSKTSSAPNAICCFLFQFTVSCPCLKAVHSCLRLLPRLLTLQSFHLSSFRRPFLRKMRSIQLSFLIFIVRRIFLSSLTLCNTSSFFTRSVHLIFFFNLPQHHVSKPSGYF